MENASEHMGKLRVKLMFDATAVDEALTAALDAGLLCDVCTTKVQTRAVMVQNEFCPNCQQVIKTYLGLIVERRLQAVLTERGLSHDAVKLMSEG
jgi:hypothetical protein